ncbi:hypothetical protein Ciccas_000427 [Cichlidogyrus casuarinus]|uniref:Par3/HAL N-terminal domain-containing protein n=1 Tax=Cichlidogyrus casuarinus TaxID=1844966 RepID=A0ABD2QQZ1_9PLAT
MKVTIVFGDFKIVVPCGDGSLSIKELGEKSIPRMQKSVRLKREEEEAKSQMADQSTEQSIPLPTEDQLEALSIKSLSLARDGGILDWDDLVCDVLDDKELVEDEIMPAPSTPPWLNPGSIGQGKSVDFPVAVANAGFSSSSMENVSSRAGDKAGSLTPGPEDSPVASPLSYHTLPRSAKSSAAKDRRKRREARRSNGQRSAGHEMGDSDSTATTEPVEIVPTKSPPVPLHDPPPVPPQVGILRLNNNLSGIYPPPELPHYTLPLDLVPGYSPAEMAMAERSLAAARNASRAPRDTEMNDADTGYKVSAVVTAASHADQRIPRKLVFELLKAACCCGETGRGKLNQFYHGDLA